MAAIKHTVLFLSNYLTKQSWAKDTPLRCTGQFSLHTFEKFSPSKAKLNYNNIHSWFTSESSRSRVSWKWSWQEFNVTLKEASARRICVNARAWAKFEGLRLDTLCWPVDLKTYWCIYQFKAQTFDQCFFSSFSCPSCTTLDESFDVCSVHCKCHTDRCSQVSLCHSREQVWWNCRYKYVLPFGMNVQKIKIKFPPFLKI